MAHGDVHRTWAQAHESGQMAVELAVTLPVVLVVLVVAVDCLVFAGACAAFDHLVPQTVLAHATSPGVAEAGTCSCEDAVLGVLEETFASELAQVAVTSASASGGITVYTCTLTAAPWPLATAGSTFMGMQVPSLLKHQCSFAVRPVAVVS